MDGTHLKGVYKGVLLIATAQDPDHHHYPLAFAVVDGEKNANWSWFLTTLKTLIPDDPQLVFCTDRNQSIIKTVHEIYPLAIHGYCIYHLANNVKGACSHVRKDVVAHEFKKIAGIYTEKEFKRKYIDLRRRYPQAAEYLDESVHERKWARCQFPGARYNIDTTNTAESMNGVFKEQRNYALLPMIDETVGKIIEWFNRYRQISIVVPQRQLLVPRVHVELHENCPIARTLHVEVLNTFERQYNVTGTDGKGYLVDLINKTCDCRHFEIDRYPCVHSLAAIMKYCRTTTDDTLEQLVENYCSKYYWMEQWTLAYCRTIYPVPHHSSWQVPEEIQSQVVFPPYVEKKKEDYKLLDSHLRENIEGRERKSMHHSRSGLVTVVTKMTTTTMTSITKKAAMREVTAKEVVTREVTTKEMMNDSNLCVMELAYIL
ncbi:uncharacterized protein LOC125592613 [Brassica napus]|uniref:uncharacterized protein LOC125592613 n=1 Tax=Brassica napus TaxID=3708 RepID=UPI002079CD5D|nr:uncharacterized protein LOC125592613 [Brassica napus]